MRRVLRFLLAALILGVLFLIGRFWSDTSVQAAVGGGGGVATVNGDINGDGKRDISDPLHMLSWLFTGGPPPVACAGGGEGFWTGDGSGITFGGNVGIGMASDPSDRLRVLGNQTILGNINFGHGLRQMLDLFGQGFGIGIQTAVLYFRTSGGFAWHLGGAHSDVSHDSGGGTTLMTLDQLGLSFGARLGQHIRLWTSDATARYFGFGIQAETLYARCGSGAGDGFAWHKGGFHDDGHRNPGGGINLMNLDEENGLVVNTRTTTRILTITGGADLAEPFDVTAAPGQAAEIKPGMVVIIDPDRAGALKLSETPADTRVAGIISGAKGLSPGMVMSAEGVDGAGGTHPVAMTGRVWCWADASSGAIQPGDRLTTSATVGHAMRVKPGTSAEGAVLGKAMSALAEGRGLVLVLVNLQ